MIELKERKLRYYLACRSIGYDLGYGVNGTGNGYTDLQCNALGYDIDTITIKFSKIQ